MLKYAVQSEDSTWWIYFIGGYDESLVMLDRLAKIAKNEFGVAREDIKFHTYKGYEYNNMQGIEFPIEGSPPDSYIILQNPPDIK